MRFIYDLDHTVIDSRHRQATLPNGDLDLDHWIKNNTPEKIARDKLLPLAGHWIRQRQRGCEIVVCTARVMGDADYQYLADHGLEFDAVLSRAAGDRTPDAEMKLRLLKKYASDRGLAWRRFCQFSVLLDDNITVIDLLTRAGLRAYNSLELNARAA